MSVGTKNRLNQIGTLCKAHLREHCADHADLVEEFIHEIEGTGKSHDPTRWSQFTDAKRSTSEMLERAEARFKEWLNG